MKPSRFERALAVVAFCALVAVLLAISAGAPAAHWRPVALFLGIGVMAALYRELAVVLVDVRARRQSTAVIPRDLRLRKPQWISAIEATPLVNVGAPFAAMAATFGFPGVGVGVLATTVGFVLFMRAMDEMLSVGALTFERDGLRVGIRGATLLIPWSAVTDVRREGSEHHRLVVLNLVGIRAIRESLQPVTRRTRFRAEIVIGSEDGLTGKLTLPPWTAGLDGAALARALIAASGRDVGRAN